MNFFELSEAEKVGLLIVFLTDGDKYDDTFNAESLRKVRIVKNDDQLYMFELLLSREQYVVHPDGIITRITKSVIDDYVSKEIIHQFNLLECREQYILLTEWLLSFKRHDTIFFCDRCHKREPDSNAGEDYWYCKVKGCRWLCCESCNIQEKYETCIMHSSLFNLLTESYSIK